MSRAAIFKAVRDEVPDVWNDPGHIHAMDNLLDAFGVPREDTGPLRINEAGKALIKEFEGLRLKGYLCPAGVPTVGYGHTGPDVKVGMVITEAEADRLLDCDLERFEKAVARMVTMQTSDNQFSALVSFAYNLGENALRNSTLLKRHNSGDHTGAADEFEKWVFAGGKRLAGLMRRRAAEARLYRRVA